VATGLDAFADDGSGILRTAGLQGTEPFYGTHQGGIVTAPQTSTYFASLHLETDKSSDLVELLKTWTDEAANLTSGKSVSVLSTETGDVEPDSGEALGLGPARLTLNLGFGPSLFSGETGDRLGLASRRPSALVELPAFPGDQLIRGRVGGDLVIQACADDPQVAFHAVRRLVASSSGAASLGWTQAGFNETQATRGTPRNLMGFKDGTVNPGGPQLDQFVWTGSEAPRWMRGGTYAVFRRIRISLQDWDTQSLTTQQQVIGRYKVSGAPLGEDLEFDPLDLDAHYGNGDPVIPIDAHVRVSSAAMNNGQMILRRSYAYDDGTLPPVASAPASQQVSTYDAGLFFCAYQRDPRKGFIPIFQNLSNLDALGQFTVHTASAIAAIPPAATGPGSWVGEHLFQD
jgi:deferrochelatase/peroxidase EfeB